MLEEAAVETLRSSIVSAKLAQPPTWIGWFEAVARKLEELERKKSPWIEREEEETEREELGVVVRSLRMEREAELTVRVNCSWTTTEPVTL